jgi:DMSO/TMAO reductase YedYZ molybdopterin-dependent catalytic subunit
MATGTSTVQGSKTLRSESKGSAPLCAGAPFAHAWGMDEGMISKGRAAIAGIIAAAVALGVAELIAIMTGAQSAPLIAVGGVVVDSVPEPVKAFAISLFGVYDKIALLVGTTLVLAGFAALIGIGARRRNWIGVAGIAIFTVIGVAAALTRPNATVLSALPALIGSLAAIPVLFFLLRPRVADSAEPGSAGAGSGDRREFVRWAGLLGAGAVLTGIAGRIFASKRDVEQARAAVQLPSPSSPAPAVPANVDPAGEPLTRYVTSNRDFYRIDTALVQPQVDPDGWSLRIHGRVKNPFTITYAELLAMPMAERYVTLACVSNEVGGDLIGNARWLGVPVKALLDRAQPLDGADQVVSTSADGWTCGTPTQALTDGRDALLAVGMNGEPLPVKHGFPVRMVVPGLYGYVSACKWIVDMELTGFADFDAYWIRRGWTQLGPIKTQSRIDVPRQNATVPAGEVVVAGIAWAQHRGITNVEVNTGDGQWRAAQLAGTVGPDTWRQWTLRWQAVPGEYTLSVRAADLTGELQSSAPVDIFPDGAEGYHTINVTVS